MEALTDETALALPKPTKNRGRCPGYLREDGTYENPLTRHFLTRVPLVEPHPLDRGTSSNRVREQQRPRWAGLTVGRTCHACYSVYDPRPLCEQVGDYDSIYKREQLCTAVASIREPGAINIRASRRYSEHEGVTEEHWFCGNHAPSAQLARDTALYNRRMAEAAARRERERPGAEFREAEHALLVEALRWRNDEVATEEGDCGDEACEHHECHLIRAAALYEEKRRARGLIPLVTALD